MGAQSVYMVLVDSLDLGYDVQSFTFEPDFSASSRTDRLARLSGLADIWCAVGRGCAGQPFDARIPAILRALDMAAKIQERAAFVRWRRIILRRFFLLLSPWLIRNYEVFGRFVFLRDDFGLQFRLGNWKGAEGTLMAYLQPNLNKLEFEKFQSIGELAYATECKRLAFEWIHENPARFAVVSLKRFFYYWNGVPRPSDSRSPWDFRNSFFLASSVLAIWGAGLAVRRKVRGAWLFAGLILTYPTTYYFVFPHARYRHPIEPELLILAVYLLLQAGKLSDPRLADAFTDGS